MLDHENHLMPDKNDLFENYRYLTAIFTCAGFSVEIIWNKTSVFLFDSHSLRSFRSMSSLNIV